MSLRAILDELREFDTPLLANTIGYIDPTPAHKYYMGGSIQSVTPTLGPTVGVAVTCEFDSSTPDEGPDIEKYNQQMDQMAAMEDPAIWVIKTVGSRPDHECVLGDGMAKELFSNGCIGAITDGGVRDINGMLTVPFAAYAKGKTIHHGAFRIRAINRPVEVGGLLIEPGDVLHANAEGVIKIPKTCLKELGAKANLMYVFEREAHQVLRQSGLPALTKRRLVQDLLVKHGFATSH